MEERLARLESHVEHIQADVTEVKADIRDLRSDIRRLDNKIDSVKDSVAMLAVQTEKAFAALGEKINASFERAYASIAASSLATEKSFSSLIRWGLLLYIGLAAGLLGAMARGFKWL